MLSSAGLEKNTTSRNMLPRGCNLLAEPVIKFEKGGELEGVHKSPPTLNRCVPIQTPWGVA